MNICEIKYSQDEYVIDNDYEEIIRNRMELFKRIQKIKKDLRCTFITVYGVKQNMHSGIVNHSIKLEDLFA